MKAEHEQDLKKTREEVEKYWEKENSLSGSNKK